jgi:hypothetical protein
MLCGPDVGAASITAATEHEVELLRGSDGARNDLAPPPNLGEHAMRKAAIAVGLALGMFFIIRAVAEPFVIDMSDPTTYRSDWGGPSLLGVLLVHCGPGVLAAVGIVMVLIRRRSSRRAQTEQRSPSVRRPPGTG